MEHQDLVVCHSLLGYNDFFTTIDDEVSSLVILTVFSMMNSTHVDRLQSFSGWDLSDIDLNLACQLAHRRLAPAAKGKLRLEVSLQRATGTPADKCPNITSTRADDATHRPPPYAGPPLEPRPGGGSGLELSSQGPAMKHHPTGRASPRSHFLSC